MKYTNIPEELLKLSSKELDNELKRQKFPAKWYFNKEYNKINKFVERIGHIVITITPTSNSNKFSTQSIDNFLYHNSPLTKEKLFELKFKNIESLYSKISSEKLAKYIKTLALELYSEENIDVQISSESVVLLIIHIPELTVTNSIELEHTVRDCYLRFKFCNYGDGFILEDPYLARTTYTVSEINKNYLHSHVGSNSPGYYSNSFCFGTSPVRDLLRTDAKSSEKVIKHLQPILLNIEEFLNWESIEGGPFKLIQDLSGDVSNYNIVLRTGIRRQTAIIMAEEVLNNPDINIKYTFELTDKYNIKLTKEVVDAIDDLLSNSYEEHCVFRINNKSYTKNSDMVRIKDYHGRQSQVLFKGEYKKITILGAEEDNTPDPPKKININILNEVVSIIETRLENYLINKQYGWLQTQRQQEEVQQLQ